MWNFFRNCWHIKDWIKNDTKLPQEVRNKIESEVEKYNALMIMADLCNRSKHLTLNRKNRVDAKIATKRLTIHVPCLHLNKEMGVTSQSGDTFAEYFYTIKDKNGNEYNVEELAQEAISNWDKIISDLSI